MHRQIEEELDTHGEQTNRSAALAPLCLWLLFTLNTKQTHLPFKRCEIHF